VGNLASLFNVSARTDGGKLGVWAARFYTTIIAQIIQTLVI